ncbi:unnamed protein product [Schistosoma curassoni]|uniref:SCP domain-containing protein n=1 Tax=Schistosoma curassoni TaxID=6186 RepID=A0A183JCX9_9TREM|nr:unnamed protein product [Schistosoma curassoni]
MVVGDSRQETLDTDFVLLATRQQGVLKWNKLLAEKAKDHVKKCILDSGNLGDLYVGKFDSVGQTVAEHTTIQKTSDIVWANTTDIGCASNKCGNRYMVVCNYAPG